MFGLFESSQDVPGEAGRPSGRDCECGSHRYSPPPARLTGPMLPADEATWLKQLAEAERSRRAARSTLTASLSTDELLAARPPQPQALPLGHSQQE